MDISHSVGPILLGAIFNSLLLGVMIVQCQTYYTHFPCDHTRLKFLVTYLLIMNLFNTGFDIALAWHYSVNLFGNFSAVENSMWLYTIEPVMTVMISTVVQVFYAWSISRISGWVWIGYAIAGSAVVQFCAGVGGSIGSSLVTDFKLFYRFRASVIVWLSLSTITDSTISVILASYLHKRRTGFSATDHLISRLIRLVIQTGLITTICAVADLVTFLCLNDNLHIFFQLILCKAYTNTLLSTLNSRTKEDVAEPRTVEAHRAVVVARGHGLEAKEPPIGCYTNEPAISHIHTDSNSGSNVRHQASKAASMVLHSTSSEMC